jgi:hypothetical protein
VNGSIEQLVVVLTALVTMILLLVVLIRLLPSLRLDTFRQRLFALRDEMFDYAMEGSISFGHPAYRLLRKSMNGFIRYGHNLTFFRMTVIMLQWRLVSGQPATKWADDWNCALKSIPDEKVRDKMQQFHTRSLALVANRLVLGSPFLIALLLFVAAHYGLMNIKEAIKRSFNTFIDPRVLEEEAARAAA